MDCKPDSILKTFLRMEVLALQGIVRAALLFVGGIVAIPIIPFVVAFGRWDTNKRLHGFAMRLLLFPSWVLSGIVFAFANPFKMFLSTLADTKVIVGMEWANRWSNGRPKKPNGHPLRRRSADERERIDAAITMGVIEDYNDEAMERGQGIDFGEGDE